jgi:hypothetical protein
LISIKNNEEFINAPIFLTIDSKPWLKIATDPSDLNRKTETSFPRAKSIGFSTRRVYERHYYAFYVGGIPRTFIQSSTIDARTRIGCTHYP